MVMAVLDARCGLSLGGHDVYLNVAGGLRIAEPAADLAVAAALVSALTGQPVPVDMVVFGEIGLGGEVRAVAQTDARLKEAARLGFGQALLPDGSGRHAGASSDGVGLHPIARLVAMTEFLAKDGPADATPDRPPARKIPAGRHA